MLQTFKFVFAVHEKSHGNSLLVIAHGLASSALSQVKSLNETKVVNCKTYDRACQGSD